MMDCLKEPAFHIGEIDESVNLSLPPASGEEYIKRVVIEAQRCDDVVVAEIDESRLKQPNVAINSLAGCIEAPAHLRPTLDWQKCQTIDFSKLRMYITRLRNKLEMEPKRKPLTTNLPDIDDQSGWVNFCTGFSGEGYELYDPTLSIVLSLSQFMIEQILEHLVQFIETQNTISKTLGQWIYALLVVLELPLNPDMCSCLRSLARACSIIRANLTTADPHEVTSLNLFICLIARYFRQLDLVDP
ncbi:gem-associated protein 2 [Orussus abietinus]|uniref:gem-associated protein 2 n=1 Tax=Orussus abietinus TaxID=222816 RepID=UPI0006257C2F|nr:gem-associated protein 2 [Orussus abietinus]